MPSPSTAGGERLHLEDRPGLGTDKLEPYLVYSLSLTLGAVNEEGIVCSGFQDWLYHKECFAKPHPCSRTCRRRA
jgi:hypothetical protein